MLNSAGTTVPFEYYLAFEFTHIVMMFVAIAFITQAAFLVRYAVKENRNVVIAMREDLSELIFRYHMFQENANIFSKLAFTTFPGWFPFIPELRSNMEVRLLEHIFISCHDLPPEFDSSKYFSVLFKVSITHSKHFILIMNLFVFTYFRRT